MELPFVGLLHTGEQAADDDQQHVVFTPARVTAGDAGRPTRTSQGGGPGSLCCCTSAGSPPDSWGGKKEGEGRNARWNQRKMKGKLVKAC